jgi:hypothetical protein
VDVHTWWPLLWVVLGVIALGVVVLVTLAVYRALQKPAPRPEDLDPEAFID